MTDRHSGYVVALHSDIRDDDAKHIINAIRMIKGVMAVQPIQAGAPDAWVAEERRDRHWREALRKLLLEGPGDE